MTSEELEYYIRSRYGMLSMDEILKVVDIDENPIIVRIEYDGDLWKAWDIDGKCYEFRKRDWS